MAGREREVEVREFEASVARAYRWELVGLSEDCCNSSFISVNSKQRFANEWGTDTIFLTCSAKTRRLHRASFPVAPPRFRPEFRKDAADYALRAYFEHDGSGTIIESSTYIIGVETGAIRTTENSLDVFELHRRLSL